MSTQDLNITPFMTPQKNVGGTSRTIPDPPPPPQILPMTNNPGAATSETPVHQPTEMELLKAAIGDMQEKFNFLFANARKEATSESPHPEDSHSSGERTSRPYEVLENVGQVRPEAPSARRRLGRSKRGRDEYLPRREETEKRGRKNSSPVRREHELNDLRDLVQREIKKQKGDGLPDDAWISNLVKTPFTEAITEVPPPSRLVLPKFELFDGSFDPVDHILYYHNVMMPLGLTNENREEEKRREKQNQADEREVQKERREKRKKNR